MASFGEKLRKLREKTGLSLVQVQEITGITNSRLSRIERNKIQCSILDLEKLASCYKSSVTSLLIDLEVISTDELIDFNYGFNGVSRLSLEEKEHIQKEIDLLNRRLK